jgi:hypothetical protein
MKTGGTNLQDSLSDAVVELLSCGPVMLVTGPGNTYGLDISAGTTELTLGLKRVLCSFTQTRRRPLKIWFIHEHKEQYILYGTLALGNSWNVV